MRNLAAISVHFQPLFTEGNDLSIALESLEDEHEVYWLRHIAEGALEPDVSSGNQVYTDLNGRGRIPKDMREAISEYSSLLFTGFYATECVKRGIESVQSEFDIYLAENLTYEQIEDEIYSVQRIRDDEEMDDNNILRSLYLDTEIDEYLRI